MNYLDVANSGFMFVLCLIPVGVIVLQALRFMIMAWKQGIEIGMDKNKLKKCITTSATISVIPALSLVSLMIAMSPNLGKFFPWLRLSNIGAGGYEPMAAGIGLEAAGFTEYSACTLGGFVVIMMVMNIGMSLAPVNCLLTLKGYDKALKKAKKTSRFLLIGTSAAFAAVVARLNVPYFTDFSKMLPFVAAVTGAVFMFICMKLKSRYPVIGDFALSIAIVAGVIVCCLVA